MNFAPLVWYLASGYTLYITLKFYRERNMLWTAIGGWACIGMTSLLIVAMVNR